MYTNKEILVLVGRNFTENRPLFPNGHSCLERHWPFWRVKKVIFWTFSKLLPIFFLQGFFSHDRKKIGILLIYLWKLVILKQISNFKIWSRFLYIYFIFWNLQGKKGNIARTYLLEITSSELYVITKKTKNYTSFLFHGPKSQKNRANPKQS